MIVRAPNSSAHSLAAAYARASAVSPQSWVAVSSRRRSGHFHLRDVHAAGLRFGEHLRGRGIVPGDIVAVQLPAWVEWMVVAIGVAHAGAVLLPVVSIYGARELKFILAQSRAKLLITPDVWRDVDCALVLNECGVLPDLIGHVVIGSAVSGAISWEQMQEDITIGAPAQRDRDDLAMLVYTSGTTADPKGVMHSARSLLAELDAQHRARGYLDGDIDFCPWPPGHVAGALSLMRFLVTGTPVVLMDHWDAGEAAMLIEKYRIVSASFTPYHLDGVLAAARTGNHDLGSLRNCLVGAAPVPPSLIARCSEIGLRTYRAYGSSEHPTVTSGTPADGMEKRLTTEGRPMPGCEIRFVDDAGSAVADGEDGELVTRGPELFVGYFDEALNEEAFLPGGWYRTGDIGRLDADGFLIISDRKKDIIIRGGENIASREVEDLLFGHPDIVEAAVVAAPDTRMGEVVRAYIVLRSGADVSIESLRTYFAGQGIARQKTPEQLVVLDTIPRNSTGKVLKHELRALARADVERNSE